MNTQNSEQQVKHGIFPFGEKNERYADVFVGQSYLAGLAAAPDASATVAHVSFDPPAATTGTFTPTATKSCSLQAAKAGIRNTVAPPAA